MNQKAKFQVCKYEKKERLHFLLWLAGLWNRETTDATTMLQTLPNGPQIELQMCMLPGGLRVVLGFLKKLRIFCGFCFVLLGDSWDGHFKGWGKGKKNTTSYWKPSLTAPQTFKHSRFQKVTFIPPLPPLLMSAETPICVAQYLIQSLGLSL